MRKELTSGETRILIVKDFSRFSRRNSLGLLELETLRDVEVCIISIDDSIAYPIRNDWILIQFKFLMNEIPGTDALQSLHSEDHTVNYYSGSKDISRITVKSVNYTDKVFTVNAINSGEIMQICSSLEMALLF